MGEYFAFLIQICLALVMFLFVICVQVLKVYGKKLKFNLVAREVLDNAELRLLKQCG